MARSGRPRPGRGAASSRRIFVYAESSPSRGSSSSSRSSSPSSGRSRPLRTSSPTRPAPAARCRDRDGRRRGAAGLHRAPRRRRDGRPRAGRERHEPSRVPQGRRSRVRPGRARRMPLDPTGTTVTVDGEEKDVYVVTIGGAAGRGLRQPLPDRRHVRRPREPERPTGVRRPGGRDPGRAGRVPDGQLHQGPEPQRVLPGADEHRAHHDPRGRRTGAAPASSVGTRSPG